MLLVFYGHFVERVVELGGEAAFPQFKLVYAFHMPLFFVLAGLLVDERATPWRAFLRERVTARLVPVAFFNLVGLGLSLAIDLAVAGGIDGARYRELLGRLATGYPSFDFMTWFLICLFHVELLHRAVGRRLRGAAARGVAAAGVFVVGWLVTWRLREVVAWTGVPANFWYVHEALVAFAFTLVGTAFRASGWLARPRSRTARLALAAACAGLVLATFGRNEGPFVFKPVVLMAVSGHGNPVLFAFTALVGSLGVVFLAQALPEIRWLRDVGRRTLALLGLNGLFYNFVNGPLAFATRSLVGGPVSAFGLCALVTALSLAVAAPVAAALERWLPQLVGWPRRRGPLLPALAPERPGSRA